MNRCPLFFVRWLFGIFLCSCSISLFAQNGHSSPHNTDISRIKTFTSRSAINPFSQPQANSAGNPGPMVSQPLGGAYTVPVVVHIISQNPNAITDQQVIDGIKDLNDAFAHAGVYAAGPGVNTGITFCLVRKDPDGGITSGITRTNSVLGDFDQDLEDDRMKNLVSWDTKEYCNIWLVDGVKSEMVTMSKFSCGTWTRQHEDGYAALSSGGDFRDGIVTNSFGTLLAHEMGHYLGLAHTFVLGSCVNNDCSVDGDGICDTPPQSVVGGSCTAPQNSCGTDTLSGSNIDRLDLNSNFMSFSGACTNSFTAGQGVKMRNVLATVRTTLTAQNKCGPTCGENIVAKFTRSNWMPTTGGVVNFTSASSGGTNYQWSVDGVVVGGNNPNYSQSFPAPGKYKVTLKVYNANINCFASYTDYVIVSCGVMARFYPDKRIIAAKDPVFLDTITFTNRSVGSSTYKWLMSNDQGMNEQVVSTDFTLKYIFKQPARYTVRLVASNGGCSDTTEQFNVTVDDGSADGSVSFANVQCYQQTKIRVAFYACNSGYAPIVPNIPISFYDGDPQTPTAHKIGSAFITPDSIPGKCCGTRYETVLDIGKSGLNQLYAVFNDNGSAIPISLPNTGQIERDYTNNVRATTDFQFKVSISPLNDTLEPGDTLHLIASAGPGTTTSIVWSTAENLSCTDCPSPIFIATRKDMTKKVVATSDYACVDSAFVDIKVPPADDYTVTINDINCSKHDSLLANFTIRDHFKRGFIPKDLKVSFYDADPSTSDAHLLGPVFITTAQSADTCTSYTHVIRGTESRTIFAVVNDNGINIPVKLPQDSLLLEKNYTNNANSFSYQPDTVQLIPADTTVPANQSLTLAIASPIYDASSINWLPGDGYALSCTNCSSPIVKIKNNSLVKMEMSNQFGCTIKGSSNIKILAPDMTVQILQTNCFTNDSSIVRFKICMNNNYDSIFKNVPISFYESDPSTGKATLLEPVFFTGDARFGNCDSFSIVVRSPSTQNIYGVVNDDGTGHSVYDETDFRNNTDSKAVTPFVVSVFPGDTTVLRPSAVQLIATVSGGNASSFTWDPLQYLSCADCAMPVATAPYSTKFKVEARNEYSCTAVGYADIKTFTGGKVNIPNGFTPNADGKNDVFYILGSNEISMLKDFSIFNRWGQKVFQVTNAPPNDPGFGWKGFVNGKEADAGTYVYFVKISFKDGTEELYKGTVTLIR